MLNDVPDGWKVCRLADVAQINIGGTPSRSNDAFWDKTGNGEAWVSIADLRQPIVTTTKETITSLGVEKSNVKYVPAGTILMSFKLTVGRVAIAGRDLYTNEAIAAFGLREEVERDYLYQYLPTFVGMVETEQAVKGKTLNKKTLAEIPVVLPPPNEQHRIAEILSSVDASIQATQALIEQAERVKRGLMEQLLTGGLGSEAIERGEVPAGWEICQLADKSKFTNGKAHEKDIDENGEFIVVNSKFISSEGSVAKKTNSAMCLAAKNDILMVMSDVPKGKAIAKCFYVDKGHLYTVNQRICRLTAQEIEPLFLFYVLNRNRYFLAFDDGVKQTNLRKNEVLECPIGVPPVDYQRKVIEILEAFTAKMDLDYKQLNRLKIIKRGLMDDLLTGKVRTV